MCWTRWSCCGRIQEMLAGKKRWHTGGFYSTDRRLDLSDSGYLRERAWWLTQEIFMTQHLREDGWGCSVSLRRWSSGQTWCTGAMVRHMVYTLWLVLLAYLSQENDSHNPNVCLIKKYTALCLHNYLLTYLLTYSMEQSPSSEANRFSTSQEIPSIYRTQRFITTFTSAQNLSLSWASLIAGIMISNPMESMDVGVRVV